MQFENALRAIQVIQDYLLDAMAPNSTLRLGTPEERAAAAVVVRMIDIYFTPIMVLTLALLTPCSPVLSALSAPNCIWHICTVCVTVGSMWIMHRLLCSAHGTC